MKNNRLLGLIPHITDALPVLIAYPSNSSVAVTKSKDGYSLNVKITKTKMETLQQKLSHEKWNRSWTETEDGLVQVSMKVLLTKPHSV